jgi:transcriptional regulator with XRE-family HTH domain
MFIGDRLRALREQKHISQGDIEERRGLQRCYISRVETGHTVPAIERVEKLAKALEVPLYRLFYDGEEPPAPQLPESRRHDVFFSGKGARYWSKLSNLLAMTDSEDRKLVLHLVSKTVALERLRKA